MKTIITYLILVVITTICISCESHKQPVMNIPTSEYVTGQYAIVKYNNNDSMVDVMYGGVIDGYINTISMERDTLVNNIDTVYFIYDIYENLKDNFFYYLEFIDDSTLTLMYDDNTMIGHKNNKLSSELKKDDSEPSEDYLWSYKVLNDSSLFIYYPYNETTDHVLFTFQAIGEDKNVAGIKNLKPLSKDAFWLFPKVKN